MDTSQKPATKYWILETRTSKWVLGTKRQEPNPRNQKIHNGSHAMGTKPGTRNWALNTGSQNLNTRYTGKQKLETGNQDTGREILEAGYWILEAGLVPESGNWEPNIPRACWAGFSVAVRKSTLEKQNWLTSPSKADRGT